MRSRALFLVLLAALAAHAQSDSERASAWQRAESALQRDDVDAAEEALRSGGAGDDAEATRLYCGVKVRAADVEELLRAKIALARGDAEKARAIAARAPSLVDAHIVASNALDEMGDFESALAELKVIATSPPPCVLLDRVLFNEGNIVAEMERGDPAPYYERAIQIAEKRDSNAAADVHNNLGQYLLRRGKLSDADAQFRAALRSPNYRTKQYPYLGLAKVDAAFGLPSTAALDLRLALSYDPWNREALDFTASLARSENATESAVGALQLVSTALQSLPRDYVAKRYGATFETATMRMRNRRDETSAVFQIKLAEWKGDFETARSLALQASARYDSPVLAMIDAELAARSGASDAAQKFARASDALTRTTTSLSGASPNAWDLAVIEQSAAAYTSFATANGRHEDAERAKILVATLDPRSFSSPTPNLQNLPLNRSFQDYAQLTPKDPAISGLSSPDNIYMMDGVVVNDAFFGQSLNTSALAPNAAPTGSERIIAPAQLSAYGGHLGDAIPVTAQDFHAEVEGQLQPGRGRAAAKAVVVPSERREDLDGRSLHANTGGSLLGKKLWLFGEATLGSTRGEPEKESIATSHLRRVEWISKVNFLPTEHFNVSTTLDHLRDATTGVADDLAGASFGTPSAIGRDDTYARTLGSLSATYIVTKDFLADARGEVDETTHSLVPNTEAGQAVQFRDPIHLLFTSGGVGFIRDSAVTRRTTFRTNTSIFSGSHSIRTGASVERDRDRRRELLSGGAIVEFTPIGTTTRSWQSNQPTESNRSAISGLYVDDTFEITNVVTLGAGVRWTHQSGDLAAGHHFDTSVFEPRLRLSVKTYDGRWNMNAAIARYSSPLKTLDLVAFGSPRRYTNGHGTATGYGGLAAVDPGLHARYDDFFRAEITREIGARGRFELRAEQWRLRSTIDDVFCTPALQRCLTNISSAQQQETSVVSSISSMKTLGKLKSVTDFWWSATYTWSRRTGNTEGPDIMMTRVVGLDPYSRTAFDLPSTTPRNGPLSNDRRHNVVASAYAEHGGFHVSAVAKWMSGAPRSKFGFSDLYGRYAYDLAPRGTLGHSPSVTDAFTELSYDKKMGGATTRVGVDIDHLFNRQTPLIEDYRYNFSEVLPALNPNYLQPITRVDPRTVRLFIRFQM